MTDGSAFSVVFVRPHRFGVLAGVSLPRARQVAEDVLHRLSPEEREVARSLSGFRRVQWVGGRLAAREAAPAELRAQWTLGMGPGGAPSPPAEFVTSISHKAHLALALVAPSRGQAIGVDVEDDERAASRGSHLFLSREEEQWIELLPVAEQPRSRVVAFALKECAYKALADRLPSALTYSDATVSTGASGAPSIRLTRSDGSGWEIDAVVEPYGTGVIAAVEAVVRSRR
jgi:4'-phosphopantetheinyl transferase EntD